MCVPLPLHIHPSVCVSVCGKHARVFCIKFSLSVCPPIHLNWIELNKLCSYVHSCGCVVQQYLPLNSHTNTHSHTYTVKQTMGNKEKPGKTDRTALRTSKLIYVVHVSGQPIWMTLGLVYNSIITHLFGYVLLCILSAFIPKMPIRIICIDMGIVFHLTIFNIKSLIFICIC